MPRRRIVPISGPDHHQRPDPGSTIIGITKVVLYRTTVTLTAAPTAEGWW
jgi:hypothetical protein